MKAPYFVLPSVTAYDTGWKAHYGFIENCDGDRFYPDGRVERGRLSFPPRLQRYANHDNRLQRYRCDRLTGKIAEDFAAILRDWFNQQYPAPENLKQWEAMCLDNRTNLGSGCASHDYFDANVAMAEAMERNSIHAPFPFSDAADVDLWGNAWAIAKRKYLS